MHEARPTTGFVAPGILKPLLDHAPFGAYLLDADLRIAYANRVTLGLFADVPHDVIGCDYAEVLHAMGAHQVDELVRMLRTTLETGHGHAASNWVLEAAGRPNFSRFEWQVERVTFPDGRFGLACYFRDTTGAERTEDARRASERFARGNVAQLDAIYTAAPLGICLFDLQFRFQRVNATLAAMNGVPAGEHIGRTPHEVVPAIAEQGEQVFRTVLDTGAPVQFEVRGDTAAEPGVERIWDEHWFPIRDPDGETSGVVAIIQDVTAQRTAEEELRNADRRKDEFIAVLAHELRNPLAPVRNAAEFLTHWPVEDGDVRRAIRMIDRQVTHMARLVDDLLDVSRLSSGRMALQLGTVEFGAIAQAGMTACRSALDARGQRLSTNLPEGPVWLNADRDRLIQVLSNLVHNAVKYTPRGGHINVSAGVEDRTLVVTVRDDGIGIPAAQLSRIFEMFAQVDGSAERHGGLGIGLTLARQLIELHGGTIVAESEGPGRGSAFTVRFPTIATPDGPARAETSRASVATRRILVADDNEDAAESLRRLLELDGHVVRTACDGEQALAIAEQFAPQIAFLDIGMPDMDGYEVARRMRSTEWGRRIQLVALTGWGQNRDREQARAAGFDGHVVKPASAEALRQIISHAEAGGA